MTVRNQVVLGAGGSGIWFDIDCLGTLVDHCTVLPNRLGACGGSPGGIFYEISYNAGIENNIVFGNHWEINEKDAYGGGVTISDSTGVEVSGNTLIFCDNGFSVLGAARGLGAKPPGPFWAAFKTDAYYARDVQIKKNIAFGDLTKAFGIAGHATIKSSSGNAFVNNQFLASNSNAAVYCDSKSMTLDAMQSMQGCVFLGNTIFTSLSPPAKANLNKAARRILQAAARIEPELGRTSVEASAIWHFPGSVSQGLFLSSDSDHLCIVDNPRPTTLDFICHKPVTLRVWVASGDFWITLSPGKATFSVKVPSGLCVVTGLSSDSTAGK